MGREEGKGVRDEGVQDEGHGRGAERQARGGQSSSDCA